MQCFSKRGGPLGFNDSVAEITLSMLAKETIQLLYPHGHSVK